VRAFALVLVLLLGTTTLSGCAGGRPHRDPNTLVVLELGDADTLNPLFSNNEYSFLYQSLIYDGLVTVGDDFKDAPDLATSWKSTPDGLHWTVEMRHDARWSDGTPLTSRDVVFTWEAQLDPATGFPYRGQFTYIKKVTAEGPYRVRFDLATRNALFTSQGLGADILPEHILGKIPHSHLRASDFGEHPVGTGPYILASWKHDENLTFTPNPHWFGGTSNIKRIVFQVVLNDQARTDAIEQGVADIDDGVPTSAFQILKADVASGRVDVHLLHVPDLFTIGPWINFKRAGLGDVVVRRAMMYGWDRTAVIRGLLHGDADVATSITPDGLRRWYDPSVTQYPYDPARARALLEDAGYNLDKDGVRRKGKVRLSYVYVFPGNGGADPNIDIASAFQADMRAIGIGITIRSLDYATFIDETNAGNYDIAYTGWGGVPDPDQISLFGCDQFPPNGNNTMYYCNKRLTSILNLGLETIDYSKRRLLYDQMQQIVANDVPMLFFFYPYFRIAIAPRVHLDYTKALPDYYIFRDLPSWTLGPLK